MGVGPTVLVQQSSTKLKLYPRIMDQINQILTVYGLSVLGISKKRTYQLSDPYSKFGANPSLKSALNGVSNFPLYLTIST